MTGVTCPCAVAQSQTGSVCRPRIGLALRLGGAPAGRRPTQAAESVKAGWIWRSRPAIDVRHACVVHSIPRLSERAGHHPPSVSGSPSRRRWRRRHESQAKVATVVAVFPTVGALVRRQACASDHRLPRVTGAAGPRDAVQYERSNQGENQWDPDRDQVCHRSSGGDGTEAGWDGEGSGGRDGGMGGLWSSGSGLEKKGERWRGGRRAVSSGAVVGILAALWCIGFGAQRELMWAKAEEEKEVGRGEEEEGSAGMPGSGSGLAATSTSDLSADRRDPADSELVRTLLERTRANKAKYDKERLDDYYRRNYRDYFTFIEGSLKRKGELTSTETGILRWLEENR